MAQKKRKREEAVRRARERERKMEAAGQWLDSVLLRGGLEAEAEVGEYARRRARELGLSSEEGNEAAPVLLPLLGDLLAAGGVGDPMTPSQPAP